MANEARRVLQLEYALRILRSDGVDPDMVRALLGGGRFRSRAREWLTKLAGERPDIADDDEALSRALAQLLKDKAASGLN